MVFSPMTVVLYRAKTISFNVRRSYFAPIKSYKQYLMVEAPGTAPGSVPSIPYSVYHHSCCQQSQYTLIKRYFQTLVIIKKIEDFFIISPIQNKSMDEERNLTNLYQFYLLKTLGVCDPEFFLAMALLLFSKPIYVNTFFQFLLIVV